MKLKEFNHIDTSPNNCFSEIDKMSLDNQRTTIPMGVLETHILIEILTPLTEHPNLITWLDERIADELLDRGFFCLIECQVTKQGRDFLATHK